MRGGVARGSRITQPAEAAAETCRMPHAASAFHHAVVLSLVADNEASCARGYLDAGELLEDQLRLMRGCLEWIRAGISRDRDGDRSRSPALMAAEAEIAARVRATDRRIVPIVELGERLGLTATASRVLWVLIAHELCPETRALVRALNTEQTLDPTTDTLRRVAYPDRFGERTALYELTHPDAPLRRFDLVVRSDGGDDQTPFYRQTWRLAWRVLSVVHGDLAPDPALTHIAAAAAARTDGRELVVASEVRARLATACRNDIIVIAHGPARSGRRSLLEAAVAQDHRHVIAIEGHAIAKEREAARSELRLLARECAVLDAVPLIRDLDALAATADRAERLDLVETELRGLVLATATAPIGRRWQRRVEHVEITPANATQRAQIWNLAFPALSLTRAAELASLYPLAPGVIRDLGTAMRARAGDVVPDPAQIATELRAVLESRLTGLASRVEVTQTWSDLVLPDDQRPALAELMSRVRQRHTVYEQWGFARKLGQGLGVSALFSGPPGTGKTMTAGLIARDLGVEVFRVDLSKIVSKWIGETEKNLGAVFDAAEAGHALLLFDEADALFGKRTEVKSSNDRHANQQVDFLLQRLDTFTGVVILTTNHETSLDTAFRRRLSMHLRFAMPDVAERTKLWQAMLPALAPTSGPLGFERLAKSYVMSAGYIRNAVVRAAFLAAAAGTPITAAHLEGAAELEYEAMGRISSASHEPT